MLFEVTLLSKTAVVIVNGQKDDDFLLDTSILSNLSNNIIHTTPQNPSPTSFHPSNNHGVG